MSCINTRKNILNNIYKVHIFWEGHKILRNLHRRFDRYYIGQIYDGDFVKFCGLLRIYELYTFRCWLKSSATDNTLKCSKFALIEVMGSKRLCLEPLIITNHKKTDKRTLVLQKKSTLSWESNSGLYISWSWWVG